MAPSPHRYMITHIAYWCTSGSYIQSRHSSLVLTGLKVEHSQLIGPLLTREPAVYDELLVEAHNTATRAFLRSIGRIFWHQLPTLPRDWVDLVDGVKVRIVANPASVAVGVHTVTSHGHALYFRREGTTKLFWLLPCHGRNVETLDYRGGSPVRTVVNASPDVQLVSNADGGMALSGRGLSGPHGWRMKERASTIVRGRIKADAI